MLQSARAARPRRQNSHRGDAEKRCPRYLQWLRGRACALDGKRGHVCQGKIEAAHVDYAGGKGIGTKVADWFTIPLCSGAHHQQHQIGWTSFEGIWRLSALEVANKLWKVWSQTAAGRDWHASREQAA